jgi:hypothetical protein
MKRLLSRWACGLLLLNLGVAAGQEVRVDFANYSRDCGIEARQEGETLRVEWAAEEGGETGVLVLDLRAGKPLIASLGLAAGGDGKGEKALLKGVDPVTFLTVGTRATPEGHPPHMSPFNVFFDNPAQRPHQTYRSRLDLKTVRVTSEGRRASVELGDLAIGPFAGQLVLTVYDRGRLVHVEAVVSTQEDRRAIVYDAGLASGDAPGPVAARMAWMDTEGRLHKETLNPGAETRRRAVRHRTILVEGDNGSVACFPPPHQFFFPRDLTDNLEFVWSGTKHRGLDDRFGFGVRQSEEGGGRYVPWSNAPPGTRQRLGVFYLLSRKPVEGAMEEVLRYTHNDRFPKLPGYARFASHWHMAITMAALKDQAEKKPPASPDFVRMFKDMGLDIVHLAEIHGDGHPQDPGPLRLPELEGMFAECRRLSDDELLFLPGEEANVYLGKPEPGKPAGHWLYLFPKPIYWIMRRGAGEPFAQPREGGGTLYRVGNREDMARLLEAEHGLAWTAHPRIKASNWTPDAYRHEDFFLADSWLGGAWKAMPADLSRPKLGERVLDLLDDMANWGVRKHVLGEVDVFKIDHAHELYGHMNVNYLRLDRVPRYGDDWRPILDALRRGRFFTTTGEVLIREFSVGGKAGGETLTLDPSGRPELRVALDWTFPLRFIEVISGDGKTVDRERIDLAGTRPFGREERALKPDLEGKTWVRLEAWDVAANGAFTQPVWLEGGARVRGSE